MSKYRKFIVTLVNIIGDAAPPESIITNKDKFNFNKYIFVPLLYANP